MPASAMLPGRLLALASLLLAACAGQLNPSVPIPKPGELGERPGVWVAYNLGCPQGCDQIRRGDIITAIDGEPVTSGAEVDAADLARGTPVRLEVQSRKLGKIDVTLVATPNEYMRPIEHAPPLWTVGAEALDRAPAWARLKAFGHATPAMRIYRLDDPRGFRNGRELYGRHTLLVYWTPDNYRIQNQRRNVALLPRVYAQLQAHEAELRASGVDTYFMFQGRYDPIVRNYTRSLIAVDPYGWAPNMIPIVANATDAGNANTLGLEHQASDLNELLFNDGHVGPILLVIDARGIVRWHSRGWHQDDPVYSLEAVIDFAVRHLGDTPPAEEVPAPEPGATPAAPDAPVVEPAPAAPLVAPPM
ncbi:MAG TPA: hypothetical protein VGB85_01880 [Nannocystis sp.]